MDIKKMERPQTEMQVLSATKRRRSLGETKKRERAIRKPTRTAVVLPGDIEWPDVDDEESQEILECVELTMTCLDFPKKLHPPLKAISSVPKSKRSEFRKNWVANTALEHGYNVSKYMSKRTEICIGVNVCSAYMEGSLTLSGLIIEKNVDPQIITKLLVPIARAKGIPVVSLTGLKESFKKACGIKCIALGFKQVCETPGSEFRPLLNLVKKYSEVDTIELRYKKLGEHLKEQEVCLMKPPKMTTRDETLPSSFDADKLIVTQDSFSIHDEIDKLEQKKTTPKLDSSYIPPKIRKMTPQ